ncbi:MAG: hypothetical protein LBH20_09315 [Treponema sp.]|nr:hypothetical protein [Treponema sp.]
MTGAVQHNNASLLLPYLNNDLLPGLREIISYSKTVRMIPEEWYDLSTRLEAVLYDLENALREAGTRPRILAFPYRGVTHDA